MSSLAILMLFLVLTVTTSAKPLAGDPPQLEDDKIGVVKIVEDNDDDRGIAPPDEPLIDLEDEDPEPEITSTPSQPDSSSNSSDGSDGGLVPKKALDDANEKTTSWISRNFVVFLVICGVVGLAVVLLICICLCKLCK